MDAYAATWNSSRCRERRFAFLFRTSKLDNRSSDLCRRRSITHESGSPSRNTVGVKDDFRKQNRQHWLARRILIQRSSRKPGREQGGFFRTIAKQKDSQLPRGK